MTVILRVHPVHLMNLKRRQVAAGPHINKANRLGLCVRPLSTSAVHRQLYMYYQYLHES